MAEEVKATPAAEAEAEAKGVDLTEVEGSGAGGQITKADVAEAPASFGPDTADPTPGAPLDEDEATAKSKRGEYERVLTGGEWVRLAATDAVEDQGGVAGTIAVVVEAPIRVCNDPECPLSPRDHTHRDTRLPITVRTRDARGDTFLLNEEDFAVVGPSGRHEVEPHG